MTNWHLPATSRRAINPLILLIVEFFPLLIFFFANLLFGIFNATGAFAVASVACLTLSIAFTRRVSPILLFNTALVAIFGSLTLVLHNSVFIKTKPTVDYTMFAAMLLFGLKTDRLFMRDALGMTFPGLEEHVWRVMTRNWVLFFAFMAAVNELAWRTLDTTSWVSFRVWAPPLATLLFGAAHIPFLLHTTDAAEEDGGKQAEHGNRTK